MKTRFDYPSNSPLQGRRLTLARLAWLAIVAMNLSVVAYGYPEYFRKLLALNFSSTNLSGPWNQQTLAAALVSLDLAPGFLVAYIVSLDALQLISFLLLGGLIFWRKSNTWLGLFASYVLVGIGSTIGGGTETLARMSSPWQELTTFTSGIMWPAFFLFFFLFPDGRFVPRWTRLFVPLWVLFYLWYAVTDLVLKLGLDTFQTFGIFFILLSVGGALISQVFRYLRVSGPVERQQTKWFLLAIALLLVWAGLTNFLLDPFLQTRGLPLSQALLLDLAWHPFGMLAMTSLPLAIAVALFRYRLWDIDIIIRKTVVYSLVTGLLALVYFGSIILLQGMFAGLAAGESPAAIVLSTLLIAALFSPLRRRVQEGVDRGFYRKKYDAEQVLAAFSARVRDEVELDRMSAELVSAIEETVQPERVSLWMVNDMENLR